MAQPSVSVLMPMRNAQAFVREALLSILSQDYSDLEVVVIDDGSTDRSRAVVESLGDPRVRVLNGPQRGISAAFNCALQAAQGAIIMRCDADDRYPPGRLAHQVAFLDRSPEYGAVCGAYRSIDDGGRLAADLCTHEPAGEITQRLLAGETLTHLCTFAIRREALVAIGGCREAFETAEDIDLQLRLAEQTRVYFDVRSTYDYRLHHTSITHRQADVRRSYYEDLARRCRRERAQGEEDCVARGELPPLPKGTGPAKASTTHLQGHLLGQAWRLHGQGRRQDALQFGVRAIRAEPRSTETWKSVIALLLKRPGSIADRN